VTEAVEALIDGEAEALTRAAIILALKGDPTALRLCFERIAPVRRGRPTPVSDFPVPAKATDVPAALAHLTTAIASGEITAEEARPIADLLDKFLTAFDAAALTARLDELERRLDGKA
jgi:hypothetical protein